MTPCVVKKCTSFKGWSALPTPRRTGSKRARGRTRFSNSLGRVCPFSRNTLPQPWGASLSQSVGTDWVLTTTQTLYAGRYEWLGSRNLHSLNARCAFSHRCAFKNREPCPCFCACSQPIAQRGLHLHESQIRCAPLGLSFKEDGEVVWYVPLKVPLKN